MATPNSGPLRVTRQSLTNMDVPLASRPFLAHRLHTYPQPSSSSSQAELSSSESSSSLAPAPVIDPSLLSAPTAPSLINGGVNLAMVTPARSPQVTTSSSADEHFQNGQDYFDSDASAAAGPSSHFKDEKLAVPQWDGFTAPPSAPLQAWQQQTPATGLPPRLTQDPDAPYDLARKKDGKIARPPNAWILYRSEMLKHLSEGKPVEGLEAALEELDNPTEDPKDSKKSKKSNKKAPTKGSQELFGQLGGGKGGRGLPQAEISRVISVLWKREDPERRRHYENLAAQAKEEHKRLYPGYKFQPMRKDEKAAHKAARQRERDECRRTRAGDKAASKITRRRNSRHKRSPSVEFGSTRLERTDSYSSQSSEQGYLHAMPLEALGSHQGYPQYMSAAHSHSTPLMGHPMSTPFPSSSRSGSISLSLPGTSSSPEYHHDFGLERGVPMFATQSDMSYDTLQQRIDFSDAPPLMGYSTLTNGYSSSTFIPGRPLAYSQPIMMGGRLNHNIPAATPYEFTAMKVPTEYLAHVQGSNEYTDETITDLAAVWCDIEEPPVPSPAPATMSVPTTIGGQSGGQTWAEHERAQGSSMSRIPMAPPGAGPEAGHSVPYFVNQYENGSGGIATPHSDHLEVPRMPTSTHSSPLRQPIFFDASKPSQNSLRLEHTPSPSMQHAMTQRAQGGDTLGQGLLPSPVDQSFPANGGLRSVQQSHAASPQFASTHYDPNSPPNMLVPRHFSNSLFPLSPTGTQLPSWAQDRSFSSSSQQMPIMPSMSMTTGQLLGDDWDETGKPMCALGSPMPLSTSAPASSMVQPSPRRVVTGYENPGI